MKPLKTLVAAGLVASLPLAALAQATPPAEPAKPAETAPAAAPAKPAAATVQVYGTLNVNLQTTKAADATNPAQNVRARTALSTDSSNIGVRGALKVNEWVGAVYQCETSANVDGIGPIGLCNRNSRIGVSGNWGTLFFGNWDTPFKAVAYGTKADDPFLNTDVYGFQGVLGSPGFNYRSSGWSTASNTTITGFDVRANNSVVYHSPKFEGLSAKVQYSANEFMNPSGTQNPELWGAAVNWDYGPVSILGALEYHDDSFGLVGMNRAAAAATPLEGPAFGATAPNTAGTATAANSENDWAWRVGAGYELASPAGATTVSGLFEELRYRQKHAGAGQVKEFNRQAWQVALKHRFEEHELRGRFGQAEPGRCTVVGASCSTAGYGAYQWAVGYSYYFAKSFQGYVDYTQIVNRQNAQYTFSIGGASAVAGSTPKGADPRALGVGLRLAF